MVTFCLFFFSLFLCWNCNWNCQLLLLNRGKRRPFTSPFPFPILSVVIGIMKEGARALTIHTLFLFLLFQLNIFCGLAWPAPPLLPPLWDYYDSKTFYIIIYWAYSTIIWKFYWYSSKIKMIILRLKRISGALLKYSGWLVFPSNNFCKLIPFFKK